VTAQIDPAPSSDVHVRVYFRRMSKEVEDFYNIEMEPSGNGNFWAVLPQPEKTKLDKKKLDNAQNPNDLWAQWWKAKEGSDARDPNNDLDKNVIRERASLGKLEKRDWMAAETDPALEQFLDNLEYEPAEYYIALIDANGNELARSPQQVVVVRTDCRAALTPQQQGFAMNLTVGETARWQAGKPVFHWECTGIVTRRDPQDVLRADDACRACVVAWWPLAGTAGALGVATAIIQNTPGEVSPSRP